MQNMEELLNQISTELTRVQNEPLRISKIDLGNAYGQLKSKRRKSKHFKFAKMGRNINGYYRFKKGFYGLSNIPTKFSEKQTEY